MNRIFRTIGRTVPSTFLLLFALSACDEEGDYESEFRVIGTAVEEGGDTEDPPRLDEEDPGTEECVCPDDSGDSSSDPGSKGKGKKGGQGKGKGPKD